MKIGVVSDTHGDFAAWRRAFEAVLHDCDIVFHCGDALYHGPKFAPGPGHGSKQLAEDLNRLDAPLLIVKGNGDSEVDSLVIEAPIQSPYALAQIDGKRYLATHGHLQPLDETLALARKWGIDYLLTGHLHVPSLCRVGGLTHLNPGTTTYPLAQDPALAVPTCAFIEAGEACIVNLETGVELEGLG